MQDIYSNEWITIQFICTCDGNFPGLIFDGCKVGCSSSSSDDDEEEGGGDEAVEDQDEEDQHIVGLEIIWRLAYSGMIKNGDVEFTGNIVLGPGAL